MTGLSVFHVFVFVPFLCIFSFSSFLPFIGKLGFTRECRQVFVFHWQAVLSHVYLCFVQRSHGSWKFWKARNYNTVEILPGNPGKRGEVVKNHGKFYFFFS